MPQTWDRYAIAAEIKRRGETLSNLAVRAGLHPSSVRTSLNRQRAIVTADIAISEFIGVPLHTLWPDRYDDKGNRLTKIRTIAKRRRAAKIKRQTAKPMKKAG
ncbi:MAG: helix-turn-helix domain-containing protein [Hyphomicrobiaceae bacterium]